MVVRQRWTSPHSAVPPRVDGRWLIILRRPFFFTTALWMFGICRQPEHPNGYHGHYHKEIKQLVGKEEIDRLNTQEHLPIFQKYFHATKKLEQTLISSKDFVNHNEEDGKPLFLDDLSH
jgi:hypothetical protein